MDPFSLSLLSLGVSSMAIRRIVQAMELAEETAEAGTKLGITGLARKLLIHAVAETSVRRGQGVNSDPATTIAELAQLDDYKGLIVDRDVPLSVLFEVEGDEIDESVSLLSRRKIDAVIYDCTGAALAALCQPRRRTDPPPLVRHLFRITGLPLVCVPASVDWQDGLNRVNGAFGVPVSEGAKAA